MTDQPHDTEAPSASMTQMDKTSMSEEARDETRIDAKDQYSAFRSWWRRTIPDCDVPYSASHYFSAWMASARYRASSAQLSIAVCSICGTEARESRFGAPCYKCVPSHPLTTTDSLKRAFYNVLCNFHVSNMAWEDGSTGFPLVDLVSNSAPCDISTGEQQLRDLADELTLAVLARSDSARVEAFPDIGTDPLKGDRRSEEEGRKLLREAYVRQQTGVPDQTALVWRGDLGRTLARLTHLEAYKANKEKPATLAQPATREDALTDGEWFYPEGDHSSDECRFSPDEVIDYALEGENVSRVVCIERAASLPSVYAAVRVWTDAEKDERQSDNDYDYTLFATAEEARAALSDSAKVGA